MNPQEIQEKLNELLWQKPIDLPQTDQWQPALTELGLKPADVTKSMVLQAIQNVRERLRQSFREHNDDPERRFTVVVPGDPEFDQPKGIRMTSAILEKEENHQPISETPADNGKVGKAKKNQTKEKKEMRVHETDARKLLVQMGRAGAVDYDCSKLSRILNSLNDFVESGDAKEPEDKESKSLRDLILQNTKDGDVVSVFVVDECQNGNGHTNEPAPANKGKTKKVKGSRGLMEKAIETARTKNENKASKATKVSKVSKETKKPKTTSKIAKEVGKKATKVSGTRSPRKGNKMGFMSAALLVLQQAKKPLNRNEILEAITKKGLWSSDGATPQNTISAGINTDIKRNGKKSEFKRAGRGLFTATVNG